jgi:fermentation-respiration switch protein FrsA (DUF1100 family)
LRVTQYYQDLARSVDYLQERSDIDRNKLAFLAASADDYGIMCLALEDRFKVAILYACGLPLRREFPFDPRRDARLRPELDPMNYVPHVRIPVLMVNSQNDPFYPLQTSQLPLYKLLGAPEKDKLHRVYNASGHGIPGQLCAEDMLSWLDQYLGKVR